jgi:hypothetical protein
MRTLPGRIVLTIRKEMTCGKQRRKRTNLFYLKVSIFCSINVTMRRPSDTGLQTIFSTALTYPPGREGLFNLVRGLPLEMKYENGMIIAEGDYVMAHGRYTRPDGPNWIVVDVMRMKDGIFEEHWDVIQDEATKEQSKSGLPMFGDRFPK